MFHDDGGTGVRTEYTSDIYIVSTVAYYAVACVRVG
jgi:hypothetical protein